MSTRHRPLTAADLLRDLTPSMRQVLALLAHAAQCARRLDQDPRQFALQVTTLGPTADASDLRSLLCLGYVACLQETTQPADACRTFQRVRSLCLPDRACLILTPAGIALADQLPPPDTGDGVPPPQRTRRAPRPHYDADTSELWLGDVLVKSWTKAAPNQKLIVLSFEEEHWRRRIDDPLPGRPDLERKERLRQAIAGLNDHQAHPLIHFYADGTGTGVCWRLAGPAAG
jgi:hypothetical protein